MKLIIVISFLLSTVSSNAEVVKISDMEIDEALETLKSDFDLKFADHEYRKKIDSVGTGIGVIGSFGATVVGYSVDDELDFLDRRVTSEWWKNCFRRVL